MTSAKPKVSLAAWSWCSCSILSSTSANCERARDRAVLSSALPSMAVLLAKLAVFKDSSARTGMKQNRNTKSDEIISWEHHYLLKYFNLCFCQCHKWFDFLILYRKKCEHRTFVNSNKCVEQKPFLWTTRDSTSACSFLKYWSAASTSCSFSSNHCSDTQDDCLDLLVTQRVTRVMAAQTNGTNTFSCFFMRNLNLKSRGSFTHFSD